MKQDIHDFTKDTEFIQSNNKWLNKALRPCRNGYANILSYGIKAPSPMRWLINSHFLLFLLAILFILCLSPRYLLLAKYVIEKYVFQFSISKPVLIVPYTPNLIPFVFGVFMATYFTSRRIQIGALFLCSAAVLLSPALERGRELTLISSVTLLVFYTICFAIIRTRLRRSQVVVLIVLCAVGLIIVCHNWEQHYASAARGIAFAPALIPMVIYSVYQQVPPRRRIAPKRYAIFHYLQLFIGTPLVSYDDIFGKSPHKLAHIRFAGMKAITVAIVAAICAWAIDQILIATPMTQLRGGSLLFFSYLYYVRVYCAFVITVNTVIGALRLFGVPVRDNFNYWLLARTPNEHWRRWNILYREWVITFIFFPIMRSKRWLFAAVMVSLLTTGILHGLYRIFAEEFDWYYFGYIMFYWSINGLAIYMVIKIPILFPQIIKRLKVQTSYIWSGIGIILTSIFYAILIGLRPYKSLPEALDYMERLVSL